jgi:23S rRNA (cytosine1962-C5)-methyltransferase
LNLPGYTGVGSLLLSEAGDAVHVDASEIGREARPMRTCPLADRAVRWIVDDAGKFTAREVRRGRRMTA